MLILTRQLIRMLMLMLRLLPKQVLNCTGNKRAQASKVEASENWQVEEQTAKVEFAGENLLTILLCSLVSSLAPWLALWLAQRVVLAGWLPHWLVAQLIAGQLAGRRTTDMHPPSKPPPMTKL